ncbi:ROK family protein [Kocuria dechangensis]|uniref:ROK family protein n=1 Tax=Kocuria dechangensis TaxID=1176249 RepID=UPI001E606F7C|nr:ROK family protein [Kocuria dechangensis]
MSAFGTSELFQLLRDGQPRTRAELAASTGFARATISSRIDELLKIGMVLPVAEAASTGGRPSARVAFNPAARVVAAADFGATHATIGITDLSGRILAKEYESLEIANGPEAVLDRLMEVVAALLRRLERDASELIAVGIGLPGPVEFSTGRPTNPPIMPGWDGFDVPAYVRRTYDVPVLVDNDVNIMALGERAASWPDEQNLIFLKVATGIGAGIISGGQLQRGADGAAGDIGHIPVSRGAGVLCRCGNTGCLEAVAAAPAVAAVLREHEAEVTTSADIVHLARGGDLAALQAVRQAGRDIGEVLTLYVTIMNPALIIIGGSLAQAGEHLLAGIREVVYSRSTPLTTQHLSIVQSRTGPDAGVIGAGIMAINHVLAPDHLEALASA